jgi:hypothetical protein
MGKATIMIFALIFALGTPAENSKRPDVATPQPQFSEQSLTNQASAIHLTIATVGPMLGPPTSRYRVGEQMPIAIDMTNTSSQSSYVCVSSDLYQDLPKLTKDGRLLPYTKWQSEQLRNTQKNQTCQHEDLPEPMLLKTNEQTVVDFLFLGDDSRLSTGALYWYDPLTPGVYELSIQRRIGCCDGPMIESNKISFEVVP